MDEEMDLNKRRLKRIHLIYYLRVFNHSTGKQLGHLVDITTEGIMLISEKPIDTGKRYLLKMTLPRDIHGQEELLLEAESIWSKKDVNPDFYDTGFTLLNISDVDRSIIEALISAYLFQD